MANLNFNQTIICGRLTADPELKTTPSGTTVTQFSVAVNRRSKDGKQEADFFNCVAWKNTAEFITKYFRKGSSIFIVGHLQTRSWKDQSGQIRYVTEIVADEARFVDSKGEGGAQSYEQPMSEQKAEPQTAAQTTTHLEEWNDDELPF